MPLYISINTMAARQNRRNKRTDPVYEIRTSKFDTNPQLVAGAAYGNATVKFVYDAQSPLINGVRSWAEVTVP